jgi:hypothetical protein
MDFDFYPQQYNFLIDKNPISGFIGGIGSGKTFTGTAWILTQALQNKKLNYYACANTYPQLKDAIYPHIFAWLERFGLKEKTDYTFNKTDKDLKFFNGSMIMFRSLQNFNMIRGGQAAGAYIDEARDITLEALQVIQGRLRQISNAQLKITTTPAGYNWIYDYWKDGLLQIFKMKTSDNKDLPPDYFQSLIKTYSKDFARQELFADFINFAGKLIYSEFNRQVNLTDIRTALQHNELIYIGMDFNVDPFCAILAVKRDKKIIAFDEIVLHDLSIKAMVQTIKEKYPNNQYHIYPDSSGKNRTLLDNKTYIGELEKYFGEENLFYWNKNPRRSERYNAVNNYLMNGNLLIYSGLDTIIKDLERVKFSDDGSFTISSKLPSDLTHISDALGYMLYYLYKNREEAQWRLT